MNKKVVKYVLVAAAVLIVAAAAYWKLRPQPQVIEMKTIKIGRADISNTVTATGTLEASVTVAVGTQVSGKVSKLYADFNSKVKKGQLLAEIDTETLQSTLASSQAGLDMAQAEYEFQKANYDRNKSLIEKKLIAQKDFDQIEYSYRSALANLNAAKAKYNKDKINLSYAYIYSPIDGVVLERNVEEGETVAANFSSPTLFTLANDLTQMKIEANVDEADIGQVRIGQRVEFTVDAFADDLFHGDVVEIHLMPATSANVVTYTVVINAPNPKSILMPGMTASVSFFVLEKKNILVIPNKAVAFMPDSALMASYLKLHPELTMSQPDRRPAGKPTGAVPPPPALGKMSPADPHRMVWVIENKKIAPRPIEVGQTDEIHYEILSGIEEGAEVIVSVTAQGSDENTTEKKTVSSPFMPKPPGSNRK